MKKMYGFFFWRFDRINNLNKLKLEAKLLFDVGELLMELLLDITSFQRRYKG